MDDDFGSSVWGDAPSVVTLSPPKVVSSSFEAIDDDGFDGFGASAAPSMSTSAQLDSTDDFDDFGDDFAAPVAQNNDFGDFGEFGDTEEPVEDFAAPAAPSTTERKPLQVKPWPSPEELRDYIHGIVDPIFGVDNSNLTDEPIRQAEGINQVLVTPASRALYTSLVQLPEKLETPTWKRSRIRRQHLIELGIPVNLDEVLPTAQAKAMPAINITTRPMSAPPSSRNGGRPSDRSRVGSPRAGTPRSALRNGIGPPVQLDQAKIDELLDLNADALTLVPLSKLEAYLKDLKSHTVQASNLLTNLLQSRDTLQQDSEMFNKLIGDLVGEATKRATGGAKGGRSTPVRKGTGA